MRKRMTFTFMCIVLLILTISFLGLYIVFHTLYIQEEVKSLENTIDLISISETNIDQYIETLNENDIRLSVIDENGNVTRDTYIYETENHRHRKEVEMALKNGSGSQTRYSQTAHMNYLYVAKYLPAQKMIIRLAMPLEGLNQSVRQTIPVFVILFALAAGIAYLCIHHFSRVLLEPIHQISLKVRRKQKEPIVFEQYKYPELQEITSSIEEMDRKIHSQIEDLEKDKRMKQQFFANASHELKTPLTSIQGYAELLDTGGVGPEIERDCVDHILASTRRMTGLIQDILIISRLESHEQPGQKEVIDFGKLVTGIIESLRAKMEQRHITVRSDMEKILVYAYRPYIEELVSNLVVNAVLYSKDGGSIDVSARKDGVLLRFEVRDTGIGIGKEEQEKVFERFYRARNHTTQGTGLGLSIVKHVVLFYDGTITLSSRENEGTSLSIVLPIVYN